jgi:ubiquinone/menaquinone biosynthesis C-methylase UbiE
MVHGGEADVLEACAGTAFLGRLIATRLPAARISALELCPEMIAEGRRRAEGLHNLEFIQGNVTAMPYADGCFDLVVTAFGLSELSSAARGECLAEMGRVLRRRGGLLVADIDDPAHHAVLFHAYRYLSRGRGAAEVLGGGLLRQMQSHGFQVARRLSGQGRLLPFQIIIAQKAGTGAGGP